MSFTIVSFTEGVKGSWHASYARDIGIQSHTVQFQTTQMERKNDVKFMLLSRNGPKYFEVHGKIFTDFQSSGSGPASCIVLYRMTGNFHLLEFLSSDVALNGLY